MRSNAVVTLLYVTLPKIWRTVNKAARSGVTRICCEEGMGHSRQTSGSAAADLADYTIFG